ncbi:MAG: sensor histidine kinase [Desulfobacteraceae bacterium]|nr:sensor histidine kinase [Desulfobacteraceae bacterium]
MMQWKLFHNLINISLKWRIFFFYLFLGLIPLLVILYSSVNAHIRSIQNITDNQVRELVDTIANQTNTLCREIYRDLYILSNLSYVQSTYGQRTTGDAMDRIREELEAFRINKGIFHRITLFSPTGKIIVTTPLISDPEASALIETGDQIHAETTHYFHREIGGDLLPKIMLFKKVYDFKDLNKPLGFASVEVPLREFTSFIESLQLEKGIKKILLNSTNEQLYTKEPEMPPVDPLADAREYWAHIPLLNWTMIVSIPESVLLRDVNDLIVKNLGITFLVVLSAIFATLMFSRRAIRPLNQIIAGAKQFAAGNLDYRIRVNSGSEARMLADEVNDMAKQLKERQEELVQMNKLASLGLLSTVIAHEVKNPLAGIKTSAQVLQRLSMDNAAMDAEGVGRSSMPALPVTIQPDDWQDMQSLAKGIVKDVNRLNKTVMNLLDFAGTQPSQIITFDLAEVIRQALRLIRVDIEKKKVAIDNRVDGFEVTADPDQMTQVFINLILNAVSAVEPDIGEIAILPINHNGECQIHIIDNGQGIPDAVINRIFDPFFSMSKRGTGLGLSIVHTLLTQNNASIAVTGRRGNGTRFILTFSDRIEEETREEPHG